MSNDMPDTGSIETVRFVADARLLSILGEQLIGSEKVGVLELVKNAYDAGASRCEVTVEGVPSLEPETRTLKDYQSLSGPIIEVKDDGSGMSREDIIDGWLRPATTKRGRIKQELKRERAEAVERGTLEVYDALVSRLRSEHGGRLPLGEKGVGRLATHRLGSNLWLRTKTKNDPMEWELRIAWSDFDALGEQAKDLSAVPLTLRRQIPTGDYGTANSGTIIACYGGREGYEWTESALVELARTLDSLRSPRATAEFLTVFRTPHVEETKLESPARLGAPFELLALVDEDGLADIDLTFVSPEHLDQAPKDFRRIDHIDLRSKDTNYWKDSAGDRRTPTCGPFMIHALCWIRIPEWLGPDHREVTSYLDQFGGLAIYRDHILAQPAQQSARSDWLGLASAQIKKSSKLSYYQIIGEIEIDQANTLSLRDRSSREGMIETEAFQDLTELTKGVLDELQFHTRRIRDEWTRKERSHGVSSTSVALASRLSAKLFGGLAESYDFNKDPLKLKEIEPRLKSAARLGAVRDALKALPDFLKLKEEERDGLIEAAGFGLAVAVGVHEFAREATAMASECRSLARRAKSEDIPTQLEHIARRADAILTEVKRIAPLRTTRTESAQSVSIKKAAESARAAFAASLDDAKMSVRIQGDDFTVLGRFGALSQVFANLLDNAIYWTAQARGKREVRVIVSPDSRTVLFADSGPGISEKIRPLLFEPFYSEKSPPSGLGLYICKYYLSQVRASIRLARSAERCELGGAQFVLTFSKSPEAVR
jgi:signal transduction histidine kinase